MLNEIANNIPNLVGIMGMSMLAITGVLILYKRTIGLYFDNKNQMQAREMLIKNLPELKKRYPELQHATI